MSTAIHNPKPLLTAKDVAERLRRAGYRISGRKRRQACDFGHVVFMQGKRVSSWKYYWYERDGDKRIHHSITIPSDGLNEREALLYGLELRREGMQESLPAPTIKRDEGLLPINCSPEEYTDAVIRQRGACASCGCTPTRLERDHDHDTGQFRELLCGNCNRGIGQLGDSPELLEKAAAYLRRHGK